MAMLKLREYQEKAVDFIYERDRAMVLASVGAGKTARALTAMSEMIESGIVERWLVLAPKRVCTDVLLFITIPGAWPLCLPFRISFETA